MNPSLSYALIADAVLVLHFGVVLFVIGGLVLVVVGNIAHWAWVNSLWFRLAHVAAIAVVVTQAWLGKVCPLTTLESWLRVQAGRAPYQDSFVQHWVQRVLFYEAPWWAFAAAYTVFALGVVAAWSYFPPKYRRT